MPAHDYKIVEYHHHDLSVGFVNQRKCFCGEKPSRRKAEALHHLAFRADSPGQVDELYHQIKALPVQILHAPKLYPEYCADYYAFFFKDPEGIEYEIVSMDRERYFPDR